MSRYISTKISSVTAAKRARPTPASLDHKIRILYAKGIRSKEIIERLRSSTDVNISEQRIEKAIRPAIERIIAANSGNLPDIYSSVFLAESVVEVQSGENIVKKSICLVVGLSSSGNVDLLDLSLAPSPQEAFWLSKLSDLRKRGLTKVAAFTIGNLTAAVQAISLIYPDASARINSWDNSVKDFCIPNTSGDKIKNLCHDISKAARCRSVFRNDRAALRVICVAVDWYFAQQSGISTHSSAKENKTLVTEVKLRTRHHSISKALKSRATPRFHSPQRYLVNNPASMVLIGVSCLIFATTPVWTNASLDDNHLFDNPSPTEEQVAFQHPDNQVLPYKRNTLESDHAFIDQNDGEQKKQSDDSSADIQDAARFGQIPASNWTTPIVFADVKPSPAVPTHASSPGSSFSPSKGISYPRIKNFPQRAWLSPEEDFNGGMYGSEFALENGDSAFSSIKLRKLIDSSLSSTYRSERPANPGLSFNPNKTKSYWDMNLKSSIADGLLVATAKLAHSSFDPDQPLDLGNSEYRDMKLALQGSMKSFSYGTNWRTTGKNHDPWKKDNNLNKDSEKWSNWASWSKGSIDIKAAYKLDQSNIHLDPNNPRYNDETVEFTLTHTLKDWPYLGYSMSYGTGTRDSSKEPDKFKPFKGDVDTITGSIYYSANTWNASFSSWHTQSVENAGGSRNSTTLGHTLNASYYPVSGFSLSPYLTLSEEYYDADSSNTSSQYLGLSISKKLKEKTLAFNAHASFYRIRNETWDYDNDGLYAQAGLTWRLGNASGRTSALGFYLTNNRYNDNVYIDSSSNDVAIWVTYRIKSSGSIFFDEKPSQGYQDLFEN